MELEVKTPSNKVLPLHPLVSYMRKMICFITYSEVSRDKRAGQGSKSKNQIIAGWSGLLK